MQRFNDQLKTFRPFLKNTIFLKMTRTSPPLLSRRALLGLALAATPVFARAQSLDQQLFGAPSGPVPAPDPARIPRRPNIEASWAWLLERTSDGTRVLAANGNTRTITTVAWSNEGQLLSIGQSQDPNGGAVLDLSQRLSENPGGLANEHTGWGAWLASGQQGDTDYAVQNTRSWDPLPPALRLAMDGEQRRGAPLDTTGAGAFLCVFPLPQNGASGAISLSNQSPSEPALAATLAALCNADAPTPVAGIAGVRKSWIDQNPLGSQRIYQAADNRQWAFWVLAP